MRSFTSARPSWSASSTARASSRSACSSCELAPRQVGDRVEPVAHPRLLGILLAHALEPVELLVDRGTHRVGQLLVGELRAVLRDDVVVAFAELLADRVHLPAQQHLALLLVEVVADLGADLVLQLEIGERLAHPREHELEPRFDVDRLQQLDSLLDRQVGRVRGRVGELAGIVDPGEHVGDTPRAAVFENRLDDGAVLAASSRARAVGVGLVRRLDCDVQRAVRADLAGADAGPADAADDERRVPFGRSPALSIVATVPTVAKRPSIRGTSTSWLPAAAAAAPARLASSVSSAIVTTICGSTTPWVRGNRGSSCVWVSDIVRV